MEMLIVFLLGAALMVVLLKRNEIKTVAKKAIEKTREKVAAAKQEEDETDSNVEVEVEVEETKPKPKTGQKAETKKEEKEGKNHVKNRGVIIALSIVILILVSFFVGTLLAKVPSTQKSTTATENPNTWQMIGADHTNNRWLADGVQSIKDAETDAAANSAAIDWVDKIKVDPELLASAAETFNVDQNINSATLVENGWATQKAVELRDKVLIQLASSRTTPDFAPLNGYNSGVNNDQVVGANNPGISGRTKSIKIILSNGDTYWILGRCGNTVTEGKPSLPPGDTDEHKKDPSKDPAAQGNAPTGGGKNEDTGPGTYISPDNMATPPPEVRVNPTQPPVVNITPAPAEPTQKPIPSSEPSAPPSDDPATERV